MTNPKPVSNVTKPLEDSGYTYCAIDQLRKQSAAKLKTKAIKIGDVDLVVHEMTAKERLDYIGYLASRHKSEETFVNDLFALQAKLIYLTVRDTKGARLIGSEDSINELAELDSDTIETIYAASMELNMLDQRTADLESAKN